VFESKQESAKVYLPKDPANPDLQFLDVNATQKFYGAGQWVEIPAKWEGEGIPVLARVGGAIPVGKSVQVRSPGDKKNSASLPEDDYRAVEIFPPKGSSHGKTFANRWYEDDGVSPPPVKISAFEVEYTSEEDKVYVSFGEQLQEGFDPAWKELEIILPSGDQRAVVFNGKEATSVKVDDKGRRHFRGKNARKV
jgi:alpha-glucosidase (family GH31 glycosyl hydrolase)